MSRWRRGRRRWAGAALVLAATAGSVVAVLAGTAGATTRPVPQIGVEYAVGLAAQQSTGAFWTPARMAAATPVLKPLTPLVAGPASGPPPGIPTGKLFNGVPTVGALFFAVKNSPHFCTASVVSSKAGNLILTAAHCVFGSGQPFKKLEFVPGYHQVGKAPHGKWAVSKIFVASGWAKGQNPNLDFAFATVAPLSGTASKIQQVTGALQLGIDRPYKRPIEVIGYNTVNTRPVGCATHSFEAKTSQGNFLEFYCHDYRDGTSGSPWIVRYNSRNGTGLVIGTIGGFELGGDFEWASYSAYFGESTYLLWRLAEV
jgi:V8-like Glu-specific endopeptidase